MALAVVACTQAQPLPATSPTPPDRLAATPTAILASTPPPTLTTGQRPQPMAGSPSKPLPQSQGDTLAQIAPCPNMGTLLFNTLPMALSDFLAFRPLGWISPLQHVFPAKHSSFALALPGHPPPQKPVYFPGDVWVTEVYFIEFLSVGKTGYQLYFSPCREFKAYFFHLASLSDKLLAELKSGDVKCAEYEGGDQRFRRCQRRTLLKVAAGELAGLSGDACCVDFGAVDYRIASLAFANPAKYSEELLQYVSPVNYFTPEVREQLESRLRSYDGTVLRTAEPKAGLIMQDFPGTAQGNWFSPGKSWATVPIDQADTFIALVHDYIGADQPIFSVGTSVKGLPFGVYSFRREREGKINRDFGQVKADGTIYCYDNFLAGKTVGGIGLGNPGGIVLLSLPSSGTLKIEKQGPIGTSCVGAMPWAFTADATIFER